MSPLALADNQLQIVLDHAERIERLYLQRWLAARFSILERVARSGVGVQRSRKLDLVHCTVQCGEEVAVNTYQP